MGGLFLSLRNAAGAMRVFERGIGVVQSNVSNVNTPGYARQRLSLAATASDFISGMPGNVSIAGTLNSRSGYAEQGVRRSIHLWAQSDERAAQLARLEPVFDIREGAGIGGAINGLFQSFSALGVAPNDPSARQVALERAGVVARSFQNTAAGLLSAMADADRGINSEVARVNDLAKQLLDINLQFKQDYRSQQDPALDARLNTVLEQLADAADFTVLRSEDGSANIFLGGQSPLVLGDRIFPIAADTGTTPAGVLDPDGSDISGLITSGRMAALLKLRNDTLPGYMNEFDRLASTLADEINAQLRAGVDRDGNAPTVDLFTYDATLGAARTLRVNNLTSDQLAMASAASPGGNGNALALAGLAGKRILDGATFTQFFAATASRAGRDLSAASELASVRSALSLQARELRDGISRVNLDEEAISLLEFQRAYQAAAKMVQALDEMTETVLNMVR